MNHVFDMVVMTTDLNNVMNLSVFKTWDALTLGGGGASFLIYYFPTSLLFFMMMITILLECKS